MHFRAGASNRRKRTRTPSKSALRAADSARSGARTQSWHATAFRDRHGNDRGDSQSPRRHSFHGKRSQSHHSLGSGRMGSRSRASAASSDGVSDAVSHCSAESRPDPEEASPYESEADQLRQRSKLNRAASRNMVATPSQTAAGVTWADEHAGDLEEFEPVATASRSRGDREGEEAGSPAESGTETRSERCLSKPSMSIPSSSRASVAHSVFSFAVGDKPVWQWEHRTGFRCYEPKDCDRIENAYMQGHDCVRVKTGKWGSTPMEIFFVDMIQHDPISGNSRKIRRLGREGLFQWFQRTRRRYTRFLFNGSLRRRDFKHYEDMRREIYTNIDRKDYNVSDYYKESGCFSYIAKTDWFFGLSMLAVLLSAVWTAVDADRSSGPNASSTQSMEAVVIDNCFCVFFSIELMIRFGAFKLKKNCMQDFWFVFDSVLLILMIAETWALPIALLLVNKPGGDAPAAGLEALRAARLVRLTRLGRIARLVRVVPEVMTLLKGIAAATRSVLVTLMLLFMLLFLFGVIFRMQAGDDARLAEIIPTVPEAMMLLLLHGTLLDSPAEKLDLIGQESGLLVFLFLVFIFLSSFTILNMLIGILCGVVSSVAEAEREQAAVQFLKSTLLELLECHDRNNDRAINNQEFDLLMNNPEVHLILSSFGVDVADLLSLKDLLFHNKLLKSSWADEDSSGDEDELLTVDVYVTVVCANGLPAADVHLLSAASSDPYVIIDRPGRANEEFRTPVVSCSLDPVWNHSGTIHDYSSNETLRFAVYDSDWGKEDDLLGKVNLTFADVYPDGYAGTLQLLGPNGQVSPSFGTLQLKVELVSEIKKKMRGEAGEPVLTFAEFLEVVLRLRGDKGATVHDIVELRHSMIQGFTHLDTLVAAVLPRKDVVAPSLSAAHVEQVQAGWSVRPQAEPQAVDSVMLACLEDLQQGQIALRAELEQMAGTHQQKYEDMADKVRLVQRHVQLLHEATCAMPGGAEQGHEDPSTKQSEVGDPN